MQKQSKAPRKTAAKKQRKTPVQMTQTEYREHYERKIRHQQFKALAFGLSTDALTTMLDVSGATIRRWKSGTIQPPRMALDLLRIRRGISLPAIFGELQGFTVGRINGETFLIPPGLHWSEGITAKGIMQWPMLRDIAMRTLAKKPALAGSRYAGQKPANDDSLPVDPLTLETVNDQAANDCSGNGQ